MPRSIRVIIFDLDGVLLDSKKVYFDATEKTLRNIGVFLPNPSVRHLTRAFAYKDQQLPYLDSIQAREFRRGFGKIWNSLCLKQANPFPDVHSALRALKEMNFTLCLASGRKLSRRQTIKQLRGFGIMDYFEIYVSRGQVKRGKPFPDQLELVAKEIGIDPKCCVAVGDMPVDVMAAKNAGMNSAAVSTGIFSRSALQSEHPDILVENLNGLIKSLIRTKRRGGRFTE
jgi:HAD superfamily hydrolase (TIGR01509 family)